MPRTSPRLVERLRELRAAVDEANGLRKAFAGITTLDEVARVVGLAPSTGARKHA